MHSWAGPTVAVPPAEIAKLHRPAQTGPAGHPWPEPIPAKKQLPTNVAVAPVPRTTPAPAAGLPPHQAFMAFELSYNIAVNIGTGGDLTKDWVVLPAEQFGGQDVECPTVRYRAEDGYYYLFGDIESYGQIFIRRTKNLTVGSWESPTSSLIPVMESPCIDRATAAKWSPKGSRNYSKGLAPSEDCAPGQPMTQIADGFYTNYWKNGSDRGGREFLKNLTAWQWSVNDPDFCDRGGKAPTYFIYGMCAQTHPQNWTGKVWGFYQLGVFNGSELDFLASYFQVAAPPLLPAKTDDRLMIPLLGNWARESTGDDSALSGQDPSLKSDDSASSARSLVLPVLLLLWTEQAAALDNGAAKRPPMGWNSWGHFKGGVSAQVLRDQADAMIELGLHDAGYRSVNTDDGWLEVNRSAEGRLVPANNFPGGEAGMRNLSAYLHARNISFGIYNANSLTTCMKRAGGLYSERLDAATYASWGVDYLKYDLCGQGNLQPFVTFQVMRDAINATNRTMVYSFEPQTLRADL